MENLTIEIKVINTDDNTSVGAHIPYNEYVETLKLTNVSIITELLPELVNEYKQKYQIKQ